MARCDIDSFGIVGGQRESAHCQGKVEAVIGHGLPQSNMIRWQCDCGEVTEEDFKASSSLTIDQGRVYEETLPGVFLHRRDLEDTHDFNI